MPGQPMAGQPMAEPILEVTDRQVAITGGEYQGTRRMSLTYKAIDRARQVLFLVTGEGKEEAISKLESKDNSIPAGRIENPNVTLITDVATPESGLPA